jgi:DNA invertase Pin-like site-specific DNA recombinase
VSFYHENLERAKAMYLSGDSLPRIEQLIGGNRGRWSEVLSKAGVELRSNGSDPKMKARREAIIAMRQSGASFGKIAVAFGITRQRACQVANGVGSRRKLPVLDEIAKARAIDMYRKGAPVSEIARVSCMSSYRIRNILNRNGVTRDLKAAKGDTGEGE